MTLQLYVCPRCGRATFFNPSTPRKAGDYTGEFCHVDGQALSYVHDVEIKPLVPA